MIYSKEVHRSWEKPIQYKLVALFLVNRKINNLNLKKRGFSMKNIMIVDDEKDVRDTVKDVLEKEGYKVTEAEDGQTCLSLLTKQKFDLIILDVMMPEMSGWDVLTEILQTKKEYQNKIMFLSVVEISEEKRQTLIKGGILDYIIKPFDIDYLVNRIKKLLG